MAKVHVELSMDKKQMLVTFLQDVDGQMDTYRKYVRVRRAFGLESFELFLDAWRAELRKLNGIVVGSRVDVAITLRNVRHHSYRELFSDKGDAPSLPEKLQLYQEAAERTDYDVSLEMLKVLQRDVRAHDWSVRRGVNREGQIETVDRLVSMDEAQVIVELDELLASALNVKEECDE